MNAKLIFAAAVLAATLIPVGAAEEPASPAETTAAEQQPRHVDIAICLDTSGSMSGLIDSAKQKLWAIVNELAAARPRPVLRVALYHYGNTSLDAETGWVQQLSPLTDDLDKVYGELFKLSTNGGTELVARVVRSATQELEWSDDPNALRIIVVAGNEPATQDTEYKLQDICHAAAAKGIIINTIHCGDAETGRQTGWADAARWADGKYAAIDQNGGTVTVQSPYDKQLAELSAKLNETYVAYGAAGEGRRENQVAQDANAASVNAPAAAERAAAKAGALYRNDFWDLVDASE
ncbi:MAG: vWA domain-containing protein, partial [Planctomycetota bacterium]